MFKNHVIGAKDEFISSDYKARNPEYPTHNGIDLVSSSGKDLSIIAIAEGKVVSAVDGISGHDEYNTCGNFVKIKHADGKYTRYLHMLKDSVCVKVGDTVKKGAKLGMMGNTGYSFGKHLHFDVSDGTTFEDPLPYLKGDKNFNVPSGTQFAKGDKVMLNNGAKFSDGSTPFDYVYTTVYTILNISNDKTEVLIGIDNAPTGWVFAKDVTKITNKSTVKVGDTIKINGNIWGVVIGVNAKGDIIKGEKL